jgi:hypothetical protein
MRYNCDSQVKQRETPQPRRRSPWLVSQSDGFRPIKQVGVAFAVGFPLVVVGVLLLAMALSSDGSEMLWWVGGGTLAAGLLAGASGRVI